MIFYMSSMVLMTNGFLKQKWTVLSLHNLHFSGNTLDFKVEGQTAFEIPLGNVSRSITAKNEVTIEFTPNDDAAVSLVELRFHVPSDTTSVADPVDVSDCYFYR